MAGPDGEAGRVGGMLSKLDIVVSVMGGYISSLAEGGSEVDVDRVGSGPEGGAMLEVDFVVVVYDRAVDHSRTVPPSHLSPGHAGPSMMMTGVSTSADIHKTPFTFCASSGMTSNRSALLYTRCSGTASTPKHDDNL
ncbi:CsMn28 [Gelatoporia subvermispora B]|uniref:CsMn28 n=1 Tax=Ceriporiopsis subvermispora (strain B) TaxID=914234 RepID=M2R3L9_CERS8|nr:CsMn28 [Gelatoporia subvermispora B]